MLSNLNDDPYEAGRDIKVVILGDNSVTGHRACEVVKLIEQQFKEEDGRLIHQWWHFDFLAFDALRELAAIEAARADIVIIGASKGGELPGMVTVWMKRWLGLRKNRPGALVAVLDSDLKKSDASRGILSQLKDAARVGHLDFFATRAKVGRKTGGDAHTSGAVRQFVMADMRTTDCRTARERPSLNIRPMLLK